MTRVTAIITTFNRAHFVGEAISSVLAQTYGDFDFLILDNSSSDGTEALVRSFSDPRIRYVRHEAMKISKQRNLAVGMAQTELLGFLDDDDIWLPNKLAAEIAVFDRHGAEVGLVYGGFQFFNEGTIFAYQHPIQRGDVLKGLLEERDGFCASASNPLLRREAILDSGGYGDIGSGEDYYLYLKMARRWTVEFTDEIVVAIRQHDGPRLIGNTGERIRLEEIILSEFSDVMDNSLKARFQKKIGGKWVRIGQSARGRKRLRSALALCPWDIETWGQSVASDLGQKTYNWIHRKAITVRHRKFLQTGNPAAAGDGR